MSWIYPGKYDGRFVKLFDKLEDEKTELKLNTNHDNLRDIEELIGEAVGYTNNLLFKAEVLENVSKTLKNDLTTHEKIMLCVDKISQAKRVLMGLSPDERKNVLDGKGFEITPKKKEISKALEILKEIITLKNKNEMVRNT